MREFNIYNETGECEVDIRPRSDAKVLCHGGRPGERGDRSDEIRPRKAHCLPRRGVQERQGSPRRPRLPPVRADHHEYSSAKASRCGSARRSQQRLEEQGAGSRLRHRGLHRPLRPPPPWRLQRRRKRPRRKGGAHGQEDRSVPSDRASDPAAQGPCLGGQRAA